MSWLVQLLLAALIAINLVVGVGCTNPNARDWETDKFWKDRDPGPANRPLTVSKQHIISRYPGRETA
jgi:hypothetical protein